MLPWLQHSTRNNIQKYKSVLVQLDHMSIIWTLELS